MKLFSSLLILLATAAEATEQVRLPFEAPSEGALQERLRYAQTQYQNQKIDIPQLASRKNLALSQACRENWNSTATLILEDPEFKMDSCLRGPLVFIIVTRQNFLLFQAFLQHWKYQVGYTGDAFKEAISRKQPDLIKGVLESKEWDGVKAENKQAILLEILCFASASGKLSLVRYFLETPQIAANLPSCEDNHGGILGPLYFAVAAKKTDLERYLRTSTEVPERLRPRKGWSLYL